VAESIRSITEEASRVKNLVEEVTTGSQEQAQGIEQVAKAVTLMEQVTQRNAANAEQGAAAAGQLTAQSQALQEIVAHLTNMEGEAMDTAGIGAPIGPGVR
jgi:methyl-accepting chemotaxis protein